MKWLKNLYVGDRADRSRYRLMRQIRRQKPTFEIYVLTLPSHPGNQLDILNANQLRYSYYREKEDLVIVGLARGKADALNLTARMVDECYHRRGNADLSAYLREKLEREGGMPQ